MKVTLAHWYKDGVPGDVVDVGADEARDMVRDGIARKAAVDALSVADLKATAEAEGVDLHGATRRADIVARLADAGHPTSSTEGQVTDGR